MNPTFMDWLICFGVVAVSGNPALGVIGAEVIVLAPTAALAFLWLARREGLTRRDLLVFAGFAWISVWHFVSFGPIVISSSLSFLARVVLALLAVRLVPSFHRLFSSVMYYLAIVSFVFYVPVILGIDLASMTSALRVPLDFEVLHIGIHNFHSAEHATRNCGFFHEPGMFAGYLLLAILFLIGDESPTARRKLIVLVIALLTTKSTTGYAALFPALALHLVSRRVEERGRLSWVHLVLAVAVVGAVAWVSYETLPFMREKIAIQYEETVESSTGAEINRMGNFLFDYEFIRRRPLLGWSPRHSVRAIINPAVMEFVTGQGNGLTGFTVKFGLLGLGLVGLCAFSLFKRLYGNALLAGVAVGVLAIMLNGEQFLDGAAFLAMLFLPKPLPQAEVGAEAEEDALPTLAAS